MPCRLRREEIVTIHVLTHRHVPARAIARQLGVAESTVRYHQGRAERGDSDGRADKPFAAEPFAPAIDAWLDQHARVDRPINARDLFDHLVATAGYPHSYKSVLRYVRDRFGAPRIRTYRRVETPPGAQAQTDWSVFTDIDLGDGPQRVSAFVMALSHSRWPAIVWSSREDQLSWLHCHNRAFERLGGVPAVNRIDNPKTAMIEGAGAWGVVHPIYAAIPTHARAPWLAPPPRARKVTLRTARLRPGRRAGWMRHSRRR
jgi:transposase